MERREINIDFTCDHCMKTRAAARFFQKLGEPERVVTAPADWYELRRSNAPPWHFCSMNCFGAWAAQQGSE